MIYDIEHTLDGFLWIATKDGLNRYDGYNFKVFLNNPFEPYSIGENNSTALFEDSRSWLWVGKLSTGVDLFDPKTHRFHHFPLNVTGDISSPSVNVLDIQEASDGSIWVLKMGVGLIRIAFPDTWKTRLPDQPDLETLASISTISLPSVQGPVAELLLDFAIVSDTSILVATNFAQYEVNPKTGQIKPINKALYTEYINRISVQTTKGVGIYTTNMQRVQHLDKGQLTQIPLPKGLYTVKAGVYPAQNGNVWIEINKNMWLMEPGKRLDFNKPDLVTDEFSTCLTYDNNDNLWIGTMGYGLRKLNASKKRFRAGAAGRSVIGVWRDLQGRYYGKTHETIYEYNAVTGVLGTQQVFQAPCKWQVQLLFSKDGRTWLVATDRENHTEIGRLFAFSPDRQMVKSYSFNAHISIYDPAILSDDKYIWITSKDCQLTRFNIETEQFDYFNYASALKEKPEIVQPRAIADGLDGTLWIGTQLGLIKATPNGKNFDYQLFSANSSNPNGLNNNEISSILPDPKAPREWLWIGTKGGGINLMHIPSGQCKHFTTADHDGLPNNVVYSILSDNQGTFWCSTNRGLANLTPIAGAAPHTYEIKAYAADMGLQSDEFNTGAYYRTQDGELMFGGVNGINQFYPEAIKIQKSKPKIMVVGLEINHQSVQFGDKDSPLTEPVEIAREIHLTHEQNNVSFEFALLDLTAPSLNRYRYQLVGLDENWVEIQGNRFAHFNHLAPGRYELKVQGKSAEGEWQETDHPIIIVVSPPWYRSTLAWMCYISLLFWAGWQVYQFQIRRVKLQEQLTYEKREAERARVLEQLKSNFFNNITHEFRTPLTLIIEPARRIRAATKDPEITQNAQLIEKNSNKLLDLVNQLLDMAKIEGGSMAVDWSYGPLSENIRDLYRNFLPLAEQKNIRLHLDIPGTDIQCQFDKIKVGHIVNNLLSNALKFTPSGGKVTLSLGVNPSSDATPGIQITVTDTGVGISADALPKIFNRFYQEDGSHTRAVEGTGIGLALTKELIELMGGQIQVESTQKQGSKFKVWLPAPDLQLSATGVDATKAHSPVDPAYTNMTDSELPVVLVIEDHAELRKFIRQSIGPNWQVVEASDGAEGINKALDLVPDIIISDVMMPQKDGYAVCDELKQNEITAHIPIILLTAKAGMDSKLKGLRTGADDYLNKPFHTEELLARMQNLIEQRRRIREYYAKRPAIMEVQAEQSTAETISEADKAFLRRFTLVLEENLSDETLGVEEFAKKMFISRVQLLRKLKALIGQSPTDYIRIYRLERAKVMLQNKEGNVMQVAARVGFVNEKYFSTVFKEHFGKSPSEM